MSINLASLEPQQLMAFKQSTQQELVHLQSSYDALIIAQNKYKDCINSVKMIEQNKDSNTDKEMLIPLTSSLYIPGFNCVDKFKIDIGTGYFVEKDNKQSIEFFNRRIDKLTGDASKLKTLITDKASLLQSIDGVIREKIIAANKNTTTAAAPTKS